MTRVLTHVEIHVSLSGDHLLLDQGFVLCVIPFLANNKFISNNHYVL